MKRPAVLKRPASQRARYQAGRAGEPSEAGRVGEASEKSTQLRKKKQRLEPRRAAVEQSGDAELMERNSGSSPRRKKSAAFDNCNTNSRAEPLMLWLGKHFGHGPWLQKPSGVYQADPVHPSSDEADEPQCSKAVEPE